MVKKDNNLFKHADKELVMDAFLCWLINKAEEDNNSKFKEAFVRELLKINQSEIASVKKLEAKKQEKNIDVVVTIKSSQDNSGKKVIIENKMRGMANEKQLIRYKNIFKDVVNYVFFKLGYVNSKDKEVVERAGYMIVDADNFKTFLDTIDDNHPFIGEFKEFLINEFVEPNKYLGKYFEDNEYEKLKNSSFQQYVMDQIYKQLLENDFKEEELFYNVGSNNDGTPWTQLRFSFLDSVYGKNVNEYLFFRIDKRKNQEQKKKNQYYLRVNLYSGQDNKHLNQKKDRKNSLRDSINSFIGKLDVVPGKVTNRGDYESEILIFFFDENNTIHNLVSVSATIAKELRSLHQKL